MASPAALPVTCVCLLLSACSRLPPTPVAAAELRSVAPLPSAQVRITGTVQAVKVFPVQVPQISGQGGRLTLTHLAPNGERVRRGDLLAELDSTQQTDLARQAQAKFEDLGYQVEQRRAQNRADAEKRLADLHQAEADLAKAQIQLRKGPLLAEIELLKNQAKFEAAQARVASLKRSMQAREQAEAAALSILELQRDRQKVGLERAQNNLSKLAIHATLDGMVALENIWRSGSMGHAREGDQLWSGQPLIRIFDPSEMEVRAFVGEPEGALLRPGVACRVRLDAYPALAFDAHLEAASPVASSALESPVKTFAARFRLHQTDPHLLPDLSAAVILEAKP
ncbi:MAG: efflux RND transporter periplasmic adaptor subunit [Acidobacteria bacterium]|nr:efflux RND transporter periplasmic adaptor subunit [Acidobacteriota bacterium]